MVNVVCESGDTKKAGHPGLFLVMGLFVFHPEEILP